MKGGFKFMEVPKLIPSVGSIVKFVVMWIIVAFLVKLVVPADWRTKLFGIS